MDFRDHGRGREITLATPLARSVSRLVCSSTVRGSGATRKKTEINKRKRSVKNNVAGSESRAKNVSHLAPVNRNCHTRKSKTIERGPPSNYRTRGRRAPVFRCGGGVTLARLPPSQPLPPLLPYPAVGASGARRQLAFPIIKLRGGRGVWAAINSRI